MNSIFRRNQALALFLFAVLSTSIPEASTPCQLWYTTPATTWRSQCLPIGNGSIGAMLYGGVGADSIQFNEITMWNGGTDTTGYYVGFGTLVLTSTVPGGSYSSYRRDLDIGEAAAHVTYTAGGIAFKREYFCSFPDSVMVCHIAAGAAGSISLTAALRICSGIPSSSVSAAGNTITLAGYEGQTPGGDLTNLNFEAEAYVKNYGGSLSVQGSSITVTNADSLDILLAAGTSFAQSLATQWRGSLPHTRVAGIIGSASAKNFTVLRSAHVADYQNLYNRFSLDLDDSIGKGTATDTRRSARTVDTTAAGKDRGLDVLFVQYGRYLTIASSRNSLPANLQGLWNNSVTPSWRSDYHSDINVEMNQSPVDPLNLPECMTPFINFINAQREIRHTRTVARYPGVRGWTVQTETNPMGGNTWNWNNPGSAWYCHYLYDHFQFNLDTGYLRTTALPILKEVCQFWQDHLVKATSGIASGKLVTPDGWSPENPVNSNSNYREAGVAYDQQLIWEVFTDYSKAEDLCNSDPVFHHTVDSLLMILDNGLHIGPGGDLVEWLSNATGNNTVGETNHRHLSHLVCLYPGYQVSPLTDTAVANAANIALTKRGDGSTGWSCAWRADCWARLLSGNKAYRQLALQMVNYVYGNLLDNCNDVFQIDGNCGAPSAVAEMLVQSHTGTIYLLPALPAAWPKGSVSGIRARDGFGISLSWANRKFTGATIHSDRGAPCAVRVDTTGVKVTCNGQPVTTTPAGRNSFQFPTVAGNDYLLSLGTISAGQRTFLHQAGVSCKVSGQSALLLFPSAGNNRIEVFDLAGRMVARKTITSERFLWDLKAGEGGIRQGIYLLRMLPDGSARQELLAKIAVF